MLTAEGGHVTHFAQGILLAQGTKALLHKVFYWLDMHKQAKQPTIQLCTITQQLQCVCISFFIQESQNVPTEHF